MPADSLTPTEIAAVHALARAICKARAAGLYIVADADALCLRVTSRAHAATLSDLRAIERTIDIDGGCGLGSPRLGAGAC